MALSRQIAWLFARETPDPESIHPSVRTEQWMLRCAIAHHSSLVSLAPRNDGLATSLRAPRFVGADARNDGVLGPFCRRLLPILVWRLSPRTRRGSRPQPVDLAARQGHADLHDPFLLLVCFWFGVVVC